METVADKDGKVVMTYFEDPNPSIGMRNRDRQEKIDRTQLIINFCMAHENLQNCVRKQRRESHTKYSTFENLDFALRNENNDNSIP